MTNRIRHGIRERSNSLYGTEEHDAPYGASSSGSVYDTYSSSLAIISEMLSELSCERIIESYFKKIIKPGDYCTLSEATEIIENEGFKDETELLLLETLKGINRMGIAKFRTWIHPDQQQHFYRALKKLEELNINPVTIPKSFGVRWVPGLLGRWFGVMGLGGSNGDVMDGAGDCHGLDEDYYDVLEEPFEIGEDIQATTNASPS